jgi:anti-sigma regulatory factor (Ser/Thr protein kinase)
MEMMKNIIISADKEELNAVLDFINKNLDFLNPSPKFRMELELSVEEAFSNIANYAYSIKNSNNQRNNPEDIVTVNYHVEKNPLKVVVEFLDYGTPFNPLKTQDPDTSLSSEDRSIGGLGIFLIKKNVDNIEYKYENNKNILILEKNLE